MARSKTIPRAYVDGFADSLETLGAEMKRRLAGELTRVDYSMPVADVREALVAIMRPYCYASRATAAQVAAEFYDGIREFQTGSRMGAIGFDGYTDVAVERRVRSAVQPLAESRGDGDAAADVARALAEYVGYGIKAAAGGTIFGNGERDERRVRFARIPRGSRSYPNGCPFCQMLASRGFKYRSELTAGKLDPDHYHDDCQCMVVPSWGEGSVEGYDRHDYVEGYQEWLDQDHGEHERHVRETQRNRYDAQGRLRSGDGRRVDEKETLTDFDRARIRSKRTAAGNATKKARRERGF
jgi:hypothetical protein